MNMRLDYLKLCRQLAGDRRLVRSYFYTAISNQSEGKIDFINFLKLNGFTVVTKEVRSFNDDGHQHAQRAQQPGHGNGHRRAGLSDHLDTVILCTGDGDFAPWWRRWPAAASTSRSAPCAR